MVVYFLDTNLIAQTTESWGVCFPDVCVTIDPRRGTNYVYTTERITGSGKTVISECTPNTGGFHDECFGFGANPVANKEGLAWRFQKTSVTSSEAGRLRASQSTSRRY